MPLAPQVIRNVEFIFAATVVERGTAMMPEVPPSPTTTIVTVEHVFRAPPVLQLASGTSATVITRNATSPATGVSVVFFANGWLYGQSIALIEVSHEVLNLDRAQLSERIMQEDAIAANDALRERLRLADAVVSGKVAATRQLPITKGSLSEHAPLWAEATIDPASFEKGAAPAGEFRILYASSRDIRWSRSPKLTVGQQGIWILRKQYIDELRSDGFTVLDRADFQPISALGRVRTLIRELSAPR